MNFKIVVVDDDDVDRYLVQRALAASSLEAELIEYQAGDLFVQAVTDPNRRLAEMGSTPPPILVLLDVNMPRMSGFDVLRILEKEVKENDLVVVTMYSSSDYAQDRADAEKYSFVKDFLVKPITAEKLEHLANSIFGVCH